MTARRLVAVAALAALLAPAAAGASDDPAQLATAVARDVVHVDPRASDLLSGAEAGRLRIRIAQRDPGRIRILVVPRAAAERNGGVQNLANDVAVRTGLEGALLVVAGDRRHIDVWITTTYASGPPRGAVQEALDENTERRIAPGLLKAVDGIARVDPGPAPPTVPGDGGIEEVVDDVGDAIRIVVFGIGGAIALVILVPVVVVALRARRRRAEGAEDLAVAKAALEEELVAVGDVLRGLDLDAEMPGADPAGREALGRAIDLYDRAKRQLARAKTPRRLQRAQSTVLRARDEAGVAQRLLTGLSAQH